MSFKNAKKDDNQLYTSGHHVTLLFQYSAVSCDTYYKKNWKDLGYVD